MRRTRVAVSLAVAGALATAACGGGTSGNGQRVIGSITPEARAALTAAAQKTASADSARMAMTFGLVSSGIPDQPDMNVTISGSGVIGFASKSGELTLDLSGIPKDLGSKTGSSDPVPARVRVVIVDGVAYMEIPPEYAAKAPAGKKWAKLSPQDSAGLFGFSGGSSLPGMPDFTDPAKALDALQAMGDTKAVGTETLRGTETTHYVTQVNLAKVSEKSAGAATSTTGAVPNLFAGLLADVTFPVDGWVGTDGLLRKVRTEIDLGAILGPLMGRLAGAFGATTSSGPAGPLVLRSTMTVELFDYGTPVAVTLPPADQVVDATQIQGLIGG
ncbi:MAG: hypothetical protein JWO37_1488 [Acidimicrobiales bacterium]|nr:hypothetical protein [Acidimicrobiales bacterium]